MSNARYASYNFWRVMYDFYSDALIKKFTFNNTMYSGFSLNDVVSEIKWNFK